MSTAPTWQHEFDEVDEAIITAGYLERWHFPNATTFETITRSRDEGPYGADAWPTGPWDAEPFNKVVWVDPATGLDCMLIRGGMGAWCGYVGVPKEHPWHG